MATYLDAVQEAALSLAFENVLSMGGFRPNLISGGFNVGKLINDMAKDEAGALPAVFTIISAGEYNAGATANVLVKSYMADGASALGVVIDTNVVWANAGAKLLSLRNHGVEQAAFDKNGKLLTNSIGAISASVLGMFGAPTDGATAVGVSIGSSVTLADVGAKLVQIKNAGTEKAFFNKDGLLSTAVNLTTAQAISGGKAGNVTALTSASASIAIDLSVDNNFSHTLTESTTLAAPSNPVAGQSGVISFTQHASAPKTLAYNAFWKFPGGTIPALSAVNSALDVFTYYVVSPSLAVCALIKGVA